MRIRGTKPEFWRSERIASVLDWGDRLVLKGLESYVDDNGVGVDDIALIVGDVFPRDMLANPRETVARVSEAITHLYQAGLVWRYEADGKRLLYVSFWETVQRIDKPGKGRFCRPDGTLNYGASEIRESVAKCREGVAPGTGEQGNRGTGAKSSVALVEGVQGETPPKPAAGKPAAKRRTQIRDDYMPPKTVIAAIREQHPTVTDTQLTYQHSKFIDHWKKTGKPMADWDAAWRNWMRTTAERGEFARAPTVNGHSPPTAQDAKIADFLAYANRPSIPELEP